ncbi:MAG: hypothetical protein KBF99_09445 [Leptospiraceae bacterium]|nr:hypothetical protein [Leptospiraceae bacterium]MBK7057040.1 hypothetical protein [Leptospiraceae bacterium]MBK9498655.1 hypothetical protein [Leptospiraceae bacterium]MBP9163397.1 hypothetical protein [Leptospiraceae bacterium]
MGFMINDGDNKDKPKKSMTGAEFKKAVENSPYLRKIAGELQQAMEEEFEQMEQEEEYHSATANIRPTQIKSPKDFNMPIYLEEDLREYFFTYTKEHKLDSTEYINKLLRKIKDRNEF